MGRFVLAALILSSSLANALVSKVRTNARTQFNSSGQLELCWLGDPSLMPQTFVQEIESFLSQQFTSRAKIEIKFDANCLAEPDPFFPIGLALYDAPGIFPGVKNEILGQFSSREVAGHPTTFSVGQWANRNLTDISLTSHFTDVLPALVEQSSPLSELGKLNLIKSIAAHEVLHALGFSHEQTHRDSTCVSGGEFYRPLVNRLVTAYDPDSIMNYCHTHGFDFETGPAVLSRLDIEGLQSEYGTPLHP